MAKAYSDDFRRKVMQAIELDGLKKCEASLLFNISRNTINLWFQRKAETGDVKPKQRKASSDNSKIGDWQKFRSFVKEHGDKQESEMAQLWEGKISQRTISRALQKIGHSRKKKLTDIANETKPNG
ncbi:MAG: IS630 transposase-related protein [Nostoc sp. DedQUE12b]|uniref:IS630 transposase-related protein n=1 Tax=Nostoc sp. DedQUE12b TaxID=3075398 RepID=UPI002AD3DE57|nr:IS630 transposase-related protein [Nostoc sp. DedQUE12b]MDZ8086409.1 IS630 transposase-related protein [Nostoc sp. DedQUE12b]